MNQNEQKEQGNTKEKEANAVPPVQASENNSKPCECTCDRVISGPEPMQGGRRQRNQNRKTNRKSNKQNKKRQSNRRQNRKSNKQNNRKQNRKSNRRSNRRQ